MLKKIVLIALITGSSFFADAQVSVIFKTGKVPLVPASPKLFLAGDFNGWSPADTAWQLKPADGGYSITKKMAAGKYSLKVTRGAWEQVESDSIGRGISNREYTVNADTTILININGWHDQFKQVPRESTKSKNVQILNEKFDIPQLGVQRRVWIYLPAGYETSGKKYPVLYMHDGQNLFDQRSTGYDEWGVDEALDKLAADKQCIVVGIDHGGNARIAEYSPYDSKYAKAKGNEYVDFLVNTLKPYVDEHYRTKKDVKHTAIAGSSMGGLISFYAILKYPGVFGKAGVFSPAFWVNPEIFKYAEETPVSKKSAFYFVCGDEEGDNMVPDMQKVAATIKAKSKTSTPMPVIVLKGEKHNEKQWKGSFPGFYEWLGW